jgi:uncharacterized iron-regulated membrane protein
MRYLWHKLHRWLGLGCAGLLVLVGLSGALLVVAKPVDRLIHPQFFTPQPQASTPALQHASLESTKELLRSRFGKDAQLTLRPPRNAQQTLSVRVRSPAWNGTVYLDPASGNEQGRRGEYEGLVNLLVKFHSSLFWPDTGKIVLAWSSLFCWLLLISGALLWWPLRRAGLFKIEMGKGLRRSLFDLHKVLGIVCAAYIAFSVSTGAYLVWRPLAGWVTTLSGETPSKAPVIDSAAPLPAHPVSLDEMLRRAQEHFPGSMVGSIQVPAGEKRPLRVRLRVADDPHPNGLSSVWLHPVSGEVLAVNRWNELDLGARAIAYVYPLHTGEYGGLLLELLTLLAGMALGVLGISGLWLWWSRLRLRRAKRLKPACG